MNVLQLRGAVQLVAFNSYKLSTFLIVTFAIIAVVEVSTIPVTLEAIRGKFSPFQIETYFSTTIIVVLSSLTLSYLRFHYPVIWDDWIKESGLVGGAKEKKRLNSFVTKAKRFGFLFILLLAILVFFIRLLIVLQNTQLRSATIFQSNSSVSPIFWAAQEFATHVLVQISIYYLFVCNFVTSKLAWSPINAITTYDYKKYQKLNKSILILTFLFAVNIGYYAAALTRWATVTNETPWMILFFILIVLGVVIFFVVGFSGIRKGILSSQKERLRGLHDIVMTINERYPILTLKQSQMTTSNVETISPSVILFADRAEREIEKHELIAEGKVINYSTLAQVVAAVVAAILSAYLQIIISRIFEVF